MEPNTKKRKYCQLYCPHCEAYVSKSTWYSHHGQFFDPSTKQWKKAATASDTSQGTQCSSSFNFGDSSDEDSGGRFQPCYFDHYNDSSSEDEEKELGDSGDGTHSSREVWEHFDDSESEDQQQDDPLTATQHGHEINPASMSIMRFAVVFILSWQAIFRISNIAVDVLFKFISVLLQKLSDFCKSAQLKLLADTFPNNMIKAQRLHSIDRDNYDQLVVCQKCSSTYEYRDLHGNNGIVTCGFIRFPRHHQARMRKPCGMPLLKSVRTSSHKTIYRPIKVFCYVSLIASIEEFVQQPGHLDLFNHWKSRKDIQTGVMSDIYDGQVWKSFQAYDGQEFLSNRYSLGLLLNVDWFNPYKHVEYSVGAMYVAILNFPRHLRYKKENMVVAGIMPGPTEPSLHMNSYLEPLTKDLLKLWKGVEMTTPEGVQTIRAALLCTACDIPATRKLGGFVGHGASKGCSRCLKTFPAFETGNLDYSGFDRSKWPKRSVDSHRTEGSNWKHATSLKQRENIEREHGVRFTELLRLPYFDSVRFAVVDPMHNILLGSAKRMMSLWRENDIIEKSSLPLIQDIVDKFVTPVDTGRIPYKISSGFSSFTADQWKNWVLIYSQIALKDILPAEHYDCWHQFVLACHIMCSRAISKVGVSKMDDHLMNFCRTVEKLFGSKACTPNLHLHGHLFECYEDYGPGDAFWLFAFERLNGILGAVSTNHQAIEIQLMRKFRTTQQVFQFFKNSSLDDDIKELLGSAEVVKGSLKYDQLSELPLLESLSLSSAEKYSEICKLVPPIKEKGLESTELSDVDSCMQSCFGELYNKTLLLHEYSCAAIVLNELYGSFGSHKANSSMVYVHTQHNNVDTMRPAIVRSYRRTTVLLHSNTARSLSAQSLGTSHSVTVYLAVINWLDAHPNKDWFGSPIEIWQKMSPLTQLSGHEAMVPLADIICRCAYIVKEVKFSIGTEEVTIVVPINRFAGIL